MSRLCNLLCALVLVGFAGLAASPARAQYQARWDQIGGAWTTGWVDGATPVCIHGTSCSCGGAKFCGAYKNGATTTAWPYGCGRPRTTWQLRCSVRKAQKFRARWDQVGGPWTTGWVIGNEPYCGHGTSCSCGGANYCGWYPSGATTTAWPYGCAVPNTTWPIRCTVEAITVPTAGAPQPAARVYSNPRIGRYFVDRCLSYAASCDQPAADAFCRAKGFARAGAFHWSYKSPTRVLAGGQVCAGSGCGGFDTIACEAGARPPLYSPAPSPRTGPIPSRPTQAPSPPPQHQSGGMIVDRPQN